MNLANGLNKKKNQYKSDVYSDATSVALLPLEDGGIRLSCISCAIVPKSLSLILGI